MTPEQREQTSVDYSIPKGQPLSIGAIGGTVPVFPKKSQREQAIEAANDKVREHYEHFAGGAWKGITPREEVVIALAVDAVLPLVEQASEYEQVGWWYEDSHTFMRKTAEPIQPLHESWEPVYRRVRKP